MRILNLTQTYAPFLEFGGPPVKVRALSEALAKRGHDVTVLTADWGFESRFPTGDEPVPGGIAPGVTTRSPFGWRREHNGVAAIYLPTWFHYRALSWNPAAKRFARARLKNFDVVHIFGLYDFLGPAVATICRRRKLPYVIEPIGMYLPIVRSLWLKRIYHATLGRKMFREARFFVATSEQEVAELASAGVPREKISLRRNGVELPEAFPERGKFRASHGISQDAKLILFLGRLSEKKSPDLLIEAFAMLLSSGAVGDLRLVLVGPDESGMKARLRQIAVRLGVTSRVLFCEPLFDQAKWGAYRDADVFVLPSQNENFGNTALEAAAVGTPVVVTENCGVAPLLAGVAGLVVAHDAKTISQAIGKLLSEPELHAKFRAGSKEAAGQLGWEEPAKKMESLYRYLVGAESRMS
jgi:glycosyltransferase involved in cell wall biosynthesis